VNKIKWKTLLPQAGPRYIRGYIGIISIFVISRSMTGNKFIVKSSLPDVMTLQVEDENEGKKVAEEMFNIWLKKSGLNYA
jgi:hypothetical protein